VSVLVDDNRGAFPIEPLVAVRMVEMPVGIDQVGDRTGAEVVGRLQYSWTRGGNAGVDEHLAPPVSTWMLPPEPSRMLTLPRSL
jgi:hypothetical protein